jgi:hypothetical protein
MKSSDRWSECNDRNSSAVQARTIYPVYPQTRRGSVRRERSDVRQSNNIQLILRPPYTSLPRHLKIHR